MTIGWLPIIPSKKEDDAEGDSAAIEYDEDDGEDDEDDDEDDDEIRGY